MDIHIKFNLTRYHEVPTMQRTTFFTPLPEIYHPCTSERNSGMETIARPLSRRVQIVHQSPDLASRVSTFELNNYSVWLSEQLI